MSNEKPDSHELFRRISQLSSESEWTSAESRQALVDAGVDPEAITARVLANLNRCKKESLVSWRNTAHAKRSALLQKLGIARTSQIDGLSRSQLLDSIKHAIGKLSPGTAEQYAVAFRKFEQASDDDLRSMLEELEMLRKVEQHEDDSL